MKKILIAATLCLWIGYALFLGVESGRVSAEEVKPRGANSYQMITGEDHEDDKGHWDALFKSDVYVFGKEPAAFLRDHVRFLPKGRALDIAMSEGRNAVFLAGKGFQVDGVDYSDEAIRKARRLAREHQVTLNTINADLTHYSIKADQYQVIVNVMFLQRSLFPQIKRGLKRGGVVVFESQTVDQLKNAPGQHISRDYLLEKGELREAFKDFQILVYRETNDGRQALASLIARKP